MRLSLIQLRCWLRNFWASYQPVMCAGCGKISFRKDVIYERHRTAGIKPLCYTCHRKLFEPWNHQDNAKDL